MLEAREVCSGATARNGGHITPPWYHDYTELVTKHGENQAHKIIKFWLSHIPELLSLAETEGLLHDSQCRLVDTFDVYADPTLFDTALKNYNAYMKELAPFNDTSRIFCAQEQFEALQLNGAKISGIIGTIAGAVHPYRLVTGVLSNLLKMHTKPSSFELFAFTPCTSITSSLSAYVVSTPKGTIAARHVVHATNAWTSHLLPEFREKVVPFCGQMSSQRPGTELGHGFIPGTPSTVSPDPMNWQGSRSFIFYNDDNELHYNYLTQQLPCAQPSSSPYPSPQGELMLGGALAIIHDVLMRQMGNSDDTKTVPELDTYLSGVLPSYWGKHWGDESPSTPEDNKTGWNKGRIKAMWTGLIGWSVDGCPWVGPILTRPGEWICAGYTGEGMVNAWRCGDAVSQMILGKSDYQAWFPESFAVSLQRHKRTKFGDLLDVFM
ncbi:FAD dependent oxidoreductase [Flagelloscypha sp. PMI_526]|nr:FAD dependent oxidoreductase [Flagelloscypha sp. PMI_526]